MTFDDDDENICPNCGANLDEQSSFDEDANVNVCKKCGEELQNHDCPDQYIWHCNKCGAILNNQYDWVGESDDYYKCTECGAINDLSDPDSNEYYEEDDLIQCPNCGAYLKNQESFDEDANVNVCEECGQELLNPESDDEYIWHCNHCEDILNNQDDWEGENDKFYKCTKCGTYNDLSNPNSYDCYDEDDLVICPNCGEVIGKFDDFDDGEDIECPNCGEVIDFNEDDEEIDDEECCDEEDNCSSSTSSTTLADENLFRQGLILKRYKKILVKHGKDFDVSEADCIEIKNPTWEVVKSYLLNILKIRKQTREKCYNQLKLNQPMWDEQISLEIIGKRNAHLLMGCYCGFSYSKNTNDYVVLDHDIFAIVSDDYIIEQFLSYYKTNTIDADKHWL